MRKVVKISFFSLLVLLLLAGSLFSAWIYTYNRLTAETLIAEISFDRIGKQVYKANLARGDLCAVEAYTIYGDQWRIDAEFLKWKYWANLLGLDSLYRLNRIEGRYQNVEDQNNKPKHAYELGSKTALDIVGIAKALGRFNFLLDAAYGSSTYKDIETDNIFKVYKTQIGIITRTAPRKKDVLGRDLPNIEITNACNLEPGIWGAFSKWINKQAIKFL
ncbi:MAG TPA: hypothetical protein VHE58_06055 [Burkholderiales bacterium]|nr:hypothetical protein [Burkholderiales bacterium]